MLPKFASVIDPAAQKEAEFTQRHGVSYAEYRQRATAWQRERFEEEATSDLSGDPPICNTKGLSPARAKWADFREWQGQEGRELQALQARRTDIKAKLARAEAGIKDGVRQAADRLLSGDDSADDTKVISATHLAEAARIALFELEEKIDRAEIRVKRLDRREQEFLQAAVLEIAKSAGLAERYMEKIREVREVAELIFGLTKALGIGPQLQNHIAFPRAVGTSGEHHDYIIGTNVRDDLWKGIMRSLRSDPRCSIPAIL
jgi:hypothetical protein